MVVLVTFSVAPGGTGLDTTCHLLTCNGADLVKEPCVNGGLGLVLTSFLGREMATWDRGLPLQAERPVVAISTTATTASQGITPPDISFVLQQPELTTRFGMAGPL